MRKSCLRSPSNTSLGEILSEVMGITLVWLWELVYCKQQMRQTLCFFILCFRFLVNYMALYPVAGRLWLKAFLPPVWLWPWHSLIKWANVNARVISRTNKKRSAIWDQHIYRYVSFDVTYWPVYPDLSRQLNGRLRASLLSLACQ